VHAPSQFLLDPPERCPHAIAPCCPFDKEQPTAVAFTDEGPDIFRQTASAAPAELIRWAGEAVRRSGGANVAQGHTAKAGAIEKGNAVIRLYVIDYALQNRSRSDKDDGLVFTFLDAQENPLAALEIVPVGRTVCGDRQMHHQGVLANPFPKDVVDRATSISR
jgi:hypothetical protein